MHRHARVRKIISPRGSFFGPPDATFRCMIGPHAFFADRGGSTLYGFDCECSPPGSEMADSALAVLSAASVSAMSPSDNMPTNRLS